jgi:hypothetical protein
MADHIYHSKQIKISKPTIGVGTAGLTCDQKDADLHSSAHQPEEIEIYSDQPETLPADNGTPPYTAAGLSIPTLNFWRNSIRKLIVMRFYGKQE